MREGAARAAEEGIPNPAGFAELILPEIGRNRSKPELSSGGLAARKRKRRELAPDKGSTSSPQARANVEVARRHPKEGGARLQKKDKPERWE
jgi:hypothetical protein